MVNLLQTLAETVLFFHPAVWAISQRIRIEREFCCDDAAVEACVERSQYARALAVIEHGRAAPVPAVSFFGRNANMTLQRIRRILGTNRSSSSRKFALGGALMFPLLVLALSAALLSHSDADSPATQVTAPNDSRPSGNPALPDEKADVSKFTLHLLHRGASDKPFYNLTLSVPPTSIQNSPANLSVTIDRTQASAIVKWLVASDYFQHARAIETQNDPVGANSQYLLRVTIGDKQYEESLGWNIGTVARLDALRKSLGGESAKSMDIILGRLAGQRKAWQSGESVGNLTTTVSVENTSIVAGQPVLVKVHIKNESREDRTYSQMALNGSDFLVTDSNGRRALLLGGYGGRTLMQQPIKAGETKLLGSFDLSADYYLRRPGRYTIAFRGYAMPPSNSLAISIEPYATGETDGDPAGRLLSLASSRWMLAGSPNATSTIRPGSNRTEAPGWQFLFVDPAKGLKGSKAIVWVWLTTQAADETTVPENHSLPASKLLGKVAAWNVYFQASPEALAIWPSVQEDVMRALEKEQTTPHEANPNAKKMSDQDYRSLHDRYKSLILETAKAGKTQEIAKLTDQFNASIGGKLLFAQVTLRSGPIANHRSVFSKFLRADRKLSIGKLHFAVSDKPVVERNPNGEGATLIASNPLGENKWPDDLQITLLMDEVDYATFRHSAAVSVEDALTERLSALAREKWQVSVGPHSKFKPGSNWGETTGRIASFVYNPPSTNNDAGHVWLWITEDPAPPTPVEKNSSQPATEYLGKLSGRHIYFSHPRTP